MKSKNMFSKTLVITMSLLFLILSVAPVNALAEHRKSSKDFVKQLPHGSHRVSYGNKHYQVHDGRFYESRRGGYVHVRPPRGLVIKSLPLAATFLVVAGITYYIYDDIYYRKIPAGYQVVDAPAKVAVVKSIAPGAKALVLPAALNVRSGPGLDHAVTFLVYSGDLLTVKSSSGDWLYVRLPDNRYGWVMTRFVSITDTGAKG